MFAIFYLKKGGQNNFNFPVEKGGFNFFKDIIASALKSFKLGKYVFHFGLK